MLHNRYSVLTNQSDTDNIVKDVMTTDKGGSRKTRQRFSMKRHMTRQNATSLKMFSTNGAGVVGGKLTSLETRQAMAWKSI